MTIHSSHQSRADSPLDGHGNRLPLPTWKPGHPCPKDWPSHIHGPKEVYDHAKAHGIDWRTLLEEAGT